MFMIRSDRTTESIEGRWLDIDEIRLISDLRVMYSKVDELFHIVAALKRRHLGADVHRYADQEVLTENISRIDEIYHWFLTLKEEARRRKA